jgi:hypothetical protein
VKIDFSSHLCGARHFRIKNLNGRPRSRPRGNRKQLFVSHRLFSFFLWKKILPQTEMIILGLSEENFRHCPFWFSQHFPPFGVDSADVKRVKLSTGTALIFFQEMFRLISIQISYFPRPGGKKWEEIR